MGKLDGKVALVTGAGQGIGRGIALAMAKEGAAIGVVGRTVSKLDSVVAEIAALGASAIAVGCDVAVRSEVDAAVAATVGAFGRLDSLINNAQTTAQRLLEDTTDADVAQAYTSGTLGTFYAMQASLPHLKVHGGTIVNFGSNTAVAGERTFGSYAMAKEAIRGLTRVASREWGPYGIRVNCICPTALSPSAAAFKETNPDVFAGYLEAIPLGRMGDPELDIGRAVAMLCSDDMSYLTGSTLMLNGGRIILG